MASNEVVLQRKGFNWGQAAVLAGGALVTGYGVGRVCHIVGKAIDHGYAIDAGLKLGKGGLDLTVRAQPSKIVG